MVLPKYQQPQRKAYAGGCLALLLLLMVRSYKSHYRYISLYMSLLTCACLFVLFVLLVLLA